MTTHSPAVLEELGATPLYVVRSKANSTTVQKTNPNIQGTVRSIPDAFLSPRVIVCEGATEVGILRSFENNMLSSEECSYALKGVNVVDGKGTDATRRAMHLKEHGYDVCLFMDSDKLDEWVVKEAKLLESGIKVVKWDELVCTEKRILGDIPDKKSLKEIVELAVLVTGKTSESILASINSGLDGKLLQSIQDIEVYENEPLLRIAIFESSTKKDKEWFKTVSRGESLGDYIFQKFFIQMQGTDFCDKLEELRGWVIG
jgi:hypothetical protein